MPLEDIFKSLGQKLVNNVSGAITGNSGGSDPATNLNQQLNGNSFPLNRHSKSSAKELLKGDAFGFVIDLINSKKLLPFHYYKEPDLNQEDRTFRNQPEVHEFMNSINTLFSNDRKRKMLIDNLEDPVILGFGIAIAPESPLFGYAPTVESNSDQLKESAKQTELSAQTISNITGLGAAKRNQVTPLSSAQSDNIGKDTNNDPLKSFISIYGTIYPEIGIVGNYVDEFRKQVKQLFKSSEATDYEGKDGEVLRKKPGIGNKFHYINEIDNLKVLDEMFIKPATFENNIAPAEKSYITLKLHEDATFFSNNLAFLYRNMSYNYALGKRLIPENLLRFNLYIKFAEMRNYTSSSDSYLRNNDNDNNFANEYTDILRSKSNCFIYELKDCYFIFDETILSSSIIQAGFNNTNKSFAGLNVKIGFRHVERNIFPFLRYYGENIALDAGKNSELASAANAKGFIWDNNLGDPNGAKNKYERLKIFIDEHPLVAHNTDNNYETLKDNVIRVEEEGAKKNVVDDFITNKLGKVNIGGINLGAEAKVLSSQVKKAGKDIAREGIKQIKGAAYGVRNELVNTLENKISDLTGFGLPRPQNIYGYRYQRDEDGELKLDSNGVPIAEKIKDNSLRGVAEKAVDAIVSGITKSDDPSKHHPGVESVNIYGDRQISPNYVSNSDKNASISGNHSVFQTIDSNGNIVKRLNPDDYAASIGENSDRHITPNYNHGKLNTVNHDLYTDDKFQKRSVPNEDVHITPNYNRGVINNQSHDLFTDEKFAKRNTPNDDRHITPNYVNGKIVSPNTHNLFTDEQFNPRVVPNEDVHITPNYNRGVLNTSNHDLFTDETFKKRISPDDDRHVTPNYDRGVLNEQSHDLYTNNTFNHRANPTGDRHVTPNYTSGALNTASHNLFTDNNFNNRVAPNDDRQITPNYNRGVLNDQSHNLYTDENFSPRNIPDDDRHITPNYNKGGIINPVQSLYTDSNFKEREQPSGDRHITPNYNDGILDTKDHNLYTDQNFSERGIPSGNVNGDQKNANKPTENLGNVINTKKSNNKDTDLNNIYD